MPVAVWQISTKKWAAVQAERSLRWTRSVTQIRLIACCF